MTMTRYCSIVLLALVGLTTFAAAGRHKQDAIRNGNVPEKAVTVYRYVLQHGQAPQGYVGGRTWENREHRLPPGGEYHEYDVNPKVRGVNRGAERIIVDLRARKGWYTADHYRTFTPIPNQGT